MENEVPAENIENTEDAQDTVDITDESPPPKTWIVFKAGGETAKGQEELFAVDSSDVAEIIRNAEVFRLPFVPPFVKGVLNFYGRPFAVVDFAKVRGQGFTNGSLFLIFKSEDDFALQVAQICEFCNDFQEEEIEKNKQDFFYNQIVFQGGRSAKTLNVTALANKVRLAVADS